MAAAEQQQPPPTTDCISQSGDGWFVEVTPEPLDVARFTAMVTAANCGAVALFVGTTRDHFDGRRVVRLEYEAYGPMALRKMQVSGDVRQLRPADRSIDRG
jgi:molybdopterin synthase catalytic subunit